MLLHSSRATSASHGGHSTLICSQLLCANRIILLTWLSTVKTATLDNITVFSLSKVTEQIRKIGSRQCDRAESVTSSAQGDTSDGHVSPGRVSTTTERCSFPTRTWWRRKKQVDLWQSSLIENTYRRTTEVLLESSGCWDWSVGSPATSLILAKKAILLV